ncbi:hypothetical protein J437_LFUL009545 [Ladona fulva]|uniref:Ubiquitin-like protease family profile domain-containing protein n=1 Tax=Ladona fulva TaxID=123851 RepID=A0A8K0K775_LADFU|nr:hypothetical protein J437_LFUL009545 [Ladona fulva]
MDIKNLMTFMIKFFGVEQICCLICRSICKILPLKICNYADPLKQCRIMEGDEGKETEEADDEVFPLSQSALNEIVRGDLISGDHINKFHEILSACTEFKPQNVFFIGALEFIKPVRRRHIQILPERAMGNTHWICTFYDGQYLHIYDSLNRNQLTTGQEAYLKRMFPQTFPCYCFDTVQKQTNLVDCGVFVAAFAASIAHDRDPKEEYYIPNRMRPHFHRVLLTGKLEPFPTIPLDKRLNVMNTTPNHASLVASG